jgi:mannose-6-phosphate isomerase-like protein (cupin superfamily)
LSEESYEDLVTPPPKKLTPPPVEFEGIKKFESGIKTNSMRFSKPIYTSKKFIFRTIEVTIPDEITGDDIPAYSVGQYQIKGDSQTKWVTYNVNALYYVRKGDPWFLIGDEGKTIQIGNYICVPKNTRHCLYNKSVNQEVLVDLIFPGKILIGNE